MCEPRGHHGRHVMAHVGGGSCDCCCGAGFRRFPTPEEERECLESYKEQLEKELDGVQRRVKEIGGK